MQTVIAPLDLLITVLTALTAGYCLALSIHAREHTTRAYAGAIGVIFGLMLIARIIVGR